MYLVYSVIILLINEASSCDYKNASSFDLRDASSFDLKTSPFNLEEVSTLSSLDLNMTLRGTPQDGALTFMEMSKKYNHSAIEYFVITKDGYNLSIFNIPGDKKRPVLCLHGVFDTSDGWLLRGKDSLAINLVDEGYDVWFNNHRGNRYSRRHETLDPDNQQFWNYSLHELAYYDLPASIDLVLKATGEDQLSLIGFSQGTSMGYVLGATRPEYNKKIKCFICLAPIAFLHNTSGLIKFLILFGEIFNKILLPVHEMVGYHSMIKGVINFVCTQLIMGYEICYAGATSFLVGQNLAGVDQTFLGTIVGHFPAGTSKKNLVHYAQIGVRKRFSNYDYGSAKNLIVYGSAEPPDYDLGKVTMPVYLLSCKNDRISVMEDVRLLATKLPNVVEWKVVGNERCNHVDHLWAVDAHQLEYPTVLEILAKCFKNTK